MSEITPVNADDAAEHPDYTADPMDMRWMVARALLDEYVKNSGKPQGHAAERLGVTQGWVSMFLSGKRVITDVETLVRMAGLLGTTIEEILPPGLQAALKEGERAAQQGQSGHPALRAATGLDAPDAADRLRQLAYDLLQVIKGSPANARREDQPRAGNRSGLPRGNRKPD